jgi:preprotein translocase subunit SecD
MRKFFTAAAVATALSVPLGFYAVSDSNAQPQQQQQTLKVGANWKPGTQWAVQAQNLQSQSASLKQRQQKPEPVVWIFTVQGETKIQNRPAYQVQIQTKDQGQSQPQVSIYIDKQSGMLLKTQSQQLVQGQWQTQTVQYAVPDGQSVAVLGTIPCLPLDVPLFSEPADGSKAFGDTEMSYELISGDEPDGAKSLDEPGFAYQIKQSVKPVSQEGAKAFGDAAPSDAVEVELQGGKQTVKQIWSASSPWAVYSNNGKTEARLIPLNK